VDSRFESGTLAELGVAAGPSPVALPDVGIITGEESGVRAIFRDLGEAFTGAALEVADPQPI